MEQQLIEVKTTGNRQDRRSYWRRQVREWRESGEKQAEYCRQRGLNQYTFYRWRRRLGPYYSSPCVTAVQNSRKLRRC